MICSISSEAKAFQSLSQLYRGRWRAQCEGKGRSGNGRTKQYGKMQAKQLQKDQDFMAQSHFRVEKADIVNGSVPHVVNAEDIIGDAPPMSGGLLLYPGDHGLNLSCLSHFSYAVTFAAL